MAYNNWRSTPAEFYSIAPLRKLTVAPLRYEATVMGRKLELSFRELINWQRFKMACIARLDFLPVLPVNREDSGRRMRDQEVWERFFLAPALATLVDAERR